MKAREIMTASPSCCRPHDPVTRAASLMAQGHWGCLPVVEPGSDRILGLLTDRDIALRVVARSLDPRTIEVEAVMSRGIVCCLADDDIEDVEECMRSHRVRRIPIVDAQGRVVGIISQADLAIRAYRERHALDAEDIARTVEALSEPSPCERR
ncbi:MAG TPA: CBS domain-containing protein [Longimicrobiales bacterium]